VKLSLRDGALELEPGRPLLMGVVNATPDSFSEPQGPKPLRRLVEQAHGLVRDGARIVDVGGESGRTDRPPVGEAEEARRIVPLVERLASAQVTVSVDTWRAGPARAALEAGAAMINDVSGLAEPALAELCAEHGAALAIAHTSAAPKTDALGDHDDVVAEVVAGLRRRARRAVQLGVPEGAIVLDPGLDLAKTPAQSLRLLRCARRVQEELGRPLLLAVSRKDFVGAVTGRRPAERGAGTLGAIEPALDLDAALLRVHDVAAARDFLSVRRALREDAGAFEAPLAQELRREEAAR